MATSELRRDRRARAIFFRTRIRRRRTASRTRCFPDQPGRLGAHAIIDAGEHVEEVVGTRTTVVRYDAWGRPVTVVEEPRQTVRRTTALAVVYVDATYAPSAAPPPY